MFAVLLTIYYVVSLQYDTQHYTALHNTMKLHDIECAVLCYAMTMAIAIAMAMAIVMAMLWCGVVKSHVVWCCVVHCHILSYHVVSHRMIRDSV